jgi:hypothetical protein
MEEDKLTNPVAVSLLGVAAIMATSADNGNSVEQTETVGKRVTP